MKKIIIFLIVVLFSLLNSALAGALFTVKSAVFDNSGNLIFLPINTSVGTLSENIKLSKVSGMNALEVDIQNAVYTGQKYDLFFSSGDLREFQIRQKTHSVVGITLNFNDKYNVSNLKVGNINGCIVIKLKSLQPYHMNYYLNTYRESDVGAKDYFENIVITSHSDEYLPVSYKHSVNEIDSAFSKTADTSVSEKKNIVINHTENNALRTRYYLNNVEKLDNVFMITGFGGVCLQKPFVLENPKRFVFDMPNTLVNKDLSNKEIPLSNGDKLKIGQFNPETARLVVVSKNAAKYIPVYFPDSQSVILANPQDLMLEHLPKYKSNIIKTSYQKSSNVDNLSFEFDKPICYALKRTAEYLMIYFLNAENYNEQNFQNVIQTTPYIQTYVSLMKNAGIRLTVPLMTRENLNISVSPDGKLFRLSSSLKKDEAIKEKLEPKVKKNEGVITSLPKYTDSKNKKVIVIDAGHGGNDCGALCDGVMEKNINLDVATRVKAILEKKGYKVFLTRNNDTYVSLEDRVIFTEGINPAVFVSIHVNSCNSSTPKGIETHYYRDDSLELADYVHTKLINKISGTSNRGLMKSRFYVIKNTTVPSVLVEIGFISNSEERAAMGTDSRKQNTAEGISEGIIEYIKHHK